MSCFGTEAAKIAQQFDLTCGQIQQATDHFVQQLESRLQDENAKTTQIPAYVSHCPTGHEEGLYLAADLGGTNLRVSIVTLHGRGKYSIEHSKAPISPAHMVCDSHQPLFAFVAAHIDSFVQSRLPLSRNGARYPLSFTFSFTVEQTSLRTGRLLKWDKGFRIPSAIGLDPSALLQRELDAIQAPVLVAALSNDAVGTYMAQQYISEGRAVVGAIFGTGTNGAYMERLTDIGKMRSSKAMLASIDGGDRMLLNVEWGAFDDETRRLPLTRFDVDLDRRSLHPGEQIYEKLTSGMYLGEIFRLAVLDAYRRSACHLQRQLGHHSPLFKAWSVSTSTLSTLADNGADRALKARQCTQEILGLEHPTADDIRGLRMLAAAIGLRAARLAGVAISAVIIRSRRLDSNQLDPSFEVSGRHGSIWARLLSLLRRSTSRIWHMISRSSRGSPRVQDVLHVGLDGSVATLYPDFVKGIRRTFDEVACIGRAGSSRIQVNFVVDGSSMGSALVAQAATI